MPHKLRKSARDQDCMVRIEGVCNGNNATVVLCHINGAGIGRKQHDLFGAFGCSSCHSWLDGGYAATGSARELRDLRHHEAVIRTQQHWLDNGMISA